MPRSAWKGPYVSVQLIKEVINVAKRFPEWWGRGRFDGELAPTVIKTQSRSSVILPDFIRCVFFIHNGSSAYRRVEITEAMVGHKLGEFAPTRKKPNHKQKTATKTR